MGINKSVLGGKPIDKKPPAFYYSSNSLDSEIDDNKDSSDEEDNR
jgi:hypothetical protein